MAVEQHIRVFPNIYQDLAHFASKIPQKATPGPGKPSPPGNGSEKPIPLEEKKSPPPGLLRMSGCGRLRQGRGYGIRSPLDQSA